MAKIKKGDQVIVIAGKEKANRVLFCLFLKTELRLKALT